MLTEKQLNEFIPDYAIEPGEFVRDAMELSWISVNDLAFKTGLSHTDILDIINGKLRITEEISEKLSTVLGPSGLYWYNLEQIFQETTKRLRNDLRN